MKNGITWVITVVVLIGLLWFASNWQELVSKSNPNDEVEQSDESVNLENKDINEMIKIAEKKQTNIATFTTNKGVFEIALYGEDVPNTVSNFVKLAKEGFYNGTRFHRVIANFMIQGGDPLSKDLAKVNEWGTGGPGYSFDDEFAKGLSNIKGTISMANSGPNTNGSQFFINVVDNKPLDFDVEPLTSKHSVFGEVVSGMEVVMDIGDDRTGENDRPVEEIIIQNITIR